MENENNEQPVENFPESEEPVEPVEPEVKYKSDNIKLIVAILLGILIGGIITFLYILGGGTTQFMSDQDCNVLIENASNLSFISGADYAVFQISTSILNNGVMPRFINNSGVIELQYLQATVNPNWTVIQPQLNNNGGNK